MLLLLQKKYTRQVYSLKHFLVSAAKPNDKSFSKYERFVTSNPLAWKLKTEFFAQGRTGELLLEEYPELAVTHQAKIYLISGPRGGNFKF